VEGDEVQSQHHEHEEDESAPEQQSGVHVHGDEVKCRPVSGGGLDQRPQRGEPTAAEKVGVGWTGCAELIDLGC
jgi:hypothetical protein